jgi:hypothetical protein
VSLHVRVNDGKPLGDIGVGRYRRERHRLAGVLERPLRAVDPGLDVELARRRDERGDVAGVELGQRSPAELVAGLVEALPDVRKPVGAGVVARAVGIERDDRDASIQRLVHRRPERVLVDDRERDAVGLGGNGRIRGVDHLGHHRVDRAGPLVLDAEQLARVLCPVLGGREERIRSHMADEDELPRRGLWEVSDRAGGRGLVVGAAGDQGGRGERCAEQAGAAQQPAPGQWTEGQGFDGLFDRGMDVAHRASFDGGRRRRGGRGMTGRGGTWTPSQPNEARRT